MNLESTQPTVVGTEVWIRHGVHLATNWNSACQLIVAHIQGSELLKLCEGGRNETREFVVG